MRLVNARLRLVGFGSLHSFIHLRSFNRVSLKVMVDWASDGGGAVEVSGGDEGVIGVAMLAELVGIATCCVSGGVGELESQLDKRGSRVWL